MISRIVAPPAVEPVSLDEAKTHLRVLDDDDDPYIEGLIIAARQMVESGESWSLERTLITTTWRATLDSFDREIQLPRPPLLAVQSVGYIDTGGTARTLDASLYTVENQGEPGRLTAAYGQVWPCPQPRNGAVTITYTAGYGPTAADVPMAIRHAIKLLIGDLYEQRVSTITGTIVNVLPTVRALLNGFQWCYR